MWTHLCNNVKCCHGFGQGWGPTVALRKRRRRRQCHRYFHLRSRRHNHNPVQRVWRRPRRQRRHRPHSRHRLQRVLLLLLRRRRPPLLQLSQRRSRLPTGQQFCLRRHCRWLQRVLLLLLLHHPPLALQVQPQRWLPPQRMPSPLQRYPSPRLQPHLQASSPGLPPSLALPTRAAVLWSGPKRRSVGWAQCVLLLDAVWAPPCSIVQHRPAGRRASLTRKPASPRPPRRPQAPSY